MTTLIELEDLAVRYRGFRLDVGRLTVSDGEFIAILGKSGCGKSTMLTVLGLLARPHDTEPGAGDWQGIACRRIALPSYRGGLQVHPWNPPKPEPGRPPRPEDLLDLERIRRSYLGFALQGGELIPSLSLHDNIRLPLELSGEDPSDARARSAKVLDELGLTRDNQQSVASELSGGQRQRGVFARALAHEPRLVLMDEPTSALDELTARSALDLLAAHARRSGQAVVMVTHDRELAEAYATRIIEMRARYPIFDGLITDACRAAELPDEIVERGPDLIEETDYAELMPRQEHPTPAGLAERLRTAVGHVRAAAGITTPLRADIGQSLLAIAAACDTPRRDWIVEGRIFRDAANPRVDARQPGLATSEADKAGAAQLGFLVSLGLRDALGPVLDRLKQKYAGFIPTSNPDAYRPSLKGRTLQVGFLWQLIGNAAVVTAISVLLVILMGMQNGLVTRFRENLTKSPTARELNLTPYGEPLTEDGLRDLLEQYDELDIVIPVVSGLIGKVARIGPVTNGDGAPEAERDGLTFVGTLPSDPRVAAVHRDLDFSGLEMHTAVLPDVLARALGVTRGDVVRLETYRSEDRSRETTRAAAIDAEVVQVIPSADEKTVYIHRDLADAMLDFKEGRGVDDLGWPAYVRAFDPQYEEYLIFTRSGLSEAEKFALKGRSLTVGELAGDHSARRFVESLKSIDGDRPRVYRAFVEWNGEAKRQSMAPASIEKLLTESDSIVLPWNPPIEARLDQHDVDLIGLSGRSRWLKKYLPDRAMVFGSKAPELSARTVGVTGEPVEASITVRSGDRTLAVPVAASIGGDTGSLVVATSALVSHLHHWQRTEADWDQHSRTFVPAYRGRHYYKLRAYVDDVYQVPEMHERFVQNGFLVNSNQSQVREIQTYIEHLDLLVDVLIAVSLAIATLATSQVFMDIVMRKQAVIGMLRIMGMRFSGIATILIIRAVLVAVVALGSCWLVGTAGAAMINAWKADTLCLLESDMFAMVGVGALICCLVGTILPLRWTKNEDPLAALRRAAEQR